MRSAVSVGTRWRDPRKDGMLSSMFFNFVDELRSAGIPASFKEHLTLLEALEKDVIEQTPEAFYYLSRATFVKDEGLIDRFDQVFQKVFKGILTDYGQQQVPIPEEWLKAVAELYLTPEYQGLGLGRRLFNAARCELAEHHCLSTIVWALADNEKATGFYRRLGGLPVRRAEERFGADILLTRIAFGFTSAPLR